MTAPDATQVGARRRQISLITGPRCPEGSRKVRFPAYMSALRAGRFLPPGNTPGNHFC